MDEEEFRRLLDLFPVVRSRDYHIDLDPSRQSTLQSVQDNELVKESQDAWDDGNKKDMENQATDLQDPFWEKLKLAAEKKVGAVEAQRFCKAFQQVHRKLVYEELNLDVAQSFINSSQRSKD